MVTSEFPPQPGGIGNHAFNLAMQLQKNGYEVGLIADVRSNDGLAEQQFDSALPFKVYRIKRHPIPIITYLKRVLIFKKLAKEHSILLASGKFPLWLVGFFPLIGAKLKVGIIHGSEVNLKGFYGKLTNKALLKFDKVIAVSNFTKSLVASLKLKDINVIPNGFSINTFNRELDNHKKLKGAPKLITVGSLSQRKGQHNVIKKLPELIKIYPSIHYHMVGILTEKDKLAELANNLKVMDYITFHGEVSQEHLISMLRNSDIFVMLSEETAQGDVEGFGIALLEANYMGVPTIGSKNCGIEEAIDNYKSGILIDPNNLEDFSMALFEILKNKKNYVENAHKWALEHTWEKCIENYLKMLKNT